MGRDMYGAMTGPSAWMMTNRWDPSFIALIFAMWVVMMEGMMLIASTPGFLLYARVVRKSDAPNRLQEAAMLRSEINALIEDAKAVLGSHDVEG